MNVHDKPPVSDNLVKKRIFAEAVRNGLSDNAANILVNTFGYLREKKLHGMCHASSAVLYVALSEAGVQCDLCTGACNYGRMEFDHSWIEVDGKIIDLAIYMPICGDRLMDINSMSGVIVFDKDVVNDRGRSCSVSYGVTPCLGEDDAAALVRGTTLDRYMSMYPWEEDGLWTVVRRVFPSGMDVDWEHIKDKYASAGWQLRTGKQEQR